MVLKHVMVVTCVSVLGFFRFIQVNFCNGAYYWRVCQPGPLCLFLSLLEPFQQTVQRLRKCQLVKERNMKFETYVLFFDIISKSEEEKVGLNFKKKKK